MIDFERVWLPQIVGYASLIASGQLENEWLGRSAPTTSVTDPEELHEHVFDDLDADAIWAENRKQGVAKPEVAIAIPEFLDAIRCLDGSNVELMVSSDAWAKVKEAANLIITAESGGCAR